MTIVVADLPLDVGDVGVQTIETSGELARHFEPEPRVFEKELERVSDLTNDRGARGGDRGIPRLLEQRPGLPDERTGGRVPVEGLSPRLDEQLTVDQDDDDRRLLTRDEERFAGDERARRQVGGERQDVVDHPRMMAPPVTSRS